MITIVGSLKLLQAGSVDLSGVQHVNGETTGVALIAVSADGENQIVVCPGANAVLRPADVEFVEIEHMMGVLEVSADTLLAAARKATGFVSLNLAPAMVVPDALLAEADLLRSRLAVTGQRSGKMASRSLRRYPRK